MSVRQVPILCLAALILTFGISGGQAAATIEGQVALGKPSAPPAPSSRYQGTITGPVAPPDPPIAIVYLEAPGPVAATTNLTAAMLQREFQFRPAILPLQTGSSVEFPNLDDTYHNIFSYSKPKRFDLGRYRKDEHPAAVRFDKPGVVKLYCEIHDHMRGTIVVLDTPYFTRTDTNGVFRLERLPVGRYTLKAWLDEKTEWKRSVELREGQTLRVDFENP